MVSTQLQQLATTRHTAGLYNQKHALQNKAWSCNTPQKCSSHSHIRSSLWSLSNGIKPFPQLLHALQARLQALNALLHCFAEPPAMSVLLQRLGCLLQ
jgi:hypothetical protein